MARKLRITPGSGALQPGAQLAPSLRGMSSTVSEQLTFGLGLTMQGAKRLVRTSTPKLALCGPQEAVGVLNLPGLTTAGIGETVAPAQGPMTLPGLTTIGTGTTEFLCDPCGIQLQVDISDIPFESDICPFPEDPGIGCDNLNTTVLVPFTGQFQFSNVQCGLSNAVLSCQFSIFNVPVSGCPFVSSFDIEVFLYRTVAQTWAIFIRYNLEAGFAGNSSQSYRLIKDTSIAACQDIDVTLGPEDICDHDGAGDTPGALSCYIHEAHWRVRTL